MDVNEPFPDTSESSAEIESANLALRSKMPDTLGASHLIPFVTVDEDSRYRSFRMNRILDLVGEDRTSNC